MFALILGGQYIMIGPHHNLGTFVIDKFLVQPKNIFLLILLQY